MLYTWDSLLETGHELIDSQHKQLFAVLNRLLKAHPSGAKKDEVERAVEFLLSYTVEHFSDEEALQLQYDYPDYWRHSEAHKELTQAAAGLAERLKKEGYSTSLLDEVHATIRDWLITHIQGDDFRMVGFIQSKMKQDQH